MTSTATAYSLDRGLPASPEAERSILGAILLDNNRALEAIETLQAQDFFLDSNRRIYLAMATLENEGKPIDRITLTTFLRDTKELEAVGGVGYISDLTDGVPETSSIAHHIKIVRGKALYRRMIVSSSATIAACMDQSEAPEVILSHIGESAMALQGNCGDSDLDLRAHVTATLEQMQIERDTPVGTLLGIPTGIAELDELTTGIRPGELWVVGAPQGRAKTALALQIARGAAKLGIPVAVRSMEMKGDPVIRRCLSAISGVKAGKFKDPRRLSADEWARIRSEAAEELASLPLILDDKPVNSLAQFIARSRLYIRRDKIKLLVVDHLFALAAVTKGNGTREKVETAVEAVRRLANEENIGVLLLHHTRKPLEPNARPTEDELKESGNVAIHAHVILMLFREIAEADSHSCRKGDFSGHDEIIAAKIRDGGERGTFDTWFDKRTLEWKSGFLRGTGQ